MMDLVQATHQILQAIQPALGPMGAAAATKVGGAAAESVWNWIKSKLTSPGATEAIQSLEKAPANDTAQKMLQLYIQQAAESDAAFREELFAHCERLAAASQPSQTAIVSGAGSAIQVSDSTDVKVRIGS